MIKVYQKAALPKGFLANAVSCGIRKSGKPDLALLYSIVPAKASCQFTGNKIQAAPLKLNQQHLQASRFFQAIIVNSGNANAFTGKSGLRDAAETAGALAKALKLKKQSVLVNSTGIIGRKLPAAKIKKAIPALVRGLSAAGISKAKRAIMTTDTFAKEVVAKLNLGGKGVTICGIAKGAGMIAPNMATMLCFILTDANITQQALNQALDSAVDDSFNCITVDGCMSTNDSVMALANAAAGNPLISGSRSLASFTLALNQVCLALAKLVVKDAEGGTKFIQIKVSGARNFKQAKIAALAVANSALFKTAIFGENPNFGRIVSALGASGIAVKEEAVKIKVSPLHKKEIDVAVSIGRGKGTAVVYTSDLTPEYIRINAEYN
jgi:glutamate N-acetyltransferase/amino-acid N-acetyltransferase